MGNFGNLGLGLSIVFGVLLLALVAELYYLLWWKRRIANTQVHHDDEEDERNYAKELLHLLCWKKPSYAEDSSGQQVNSSNESPESAINGFEEPDLELGSSKDLLLKNFGEETIEAELMRLHNLAGPPRFLFTISEETKEDLESEDGKSRSRKGSRARSLSDVMVALDRTPFLTPLSSPPRKVPPLEVYNHQGFNPLFESSTDAELNRLRSSPPPKFKFLRDAEEKLMRRLLEEAERTAALRNLQDSRVKSEAPVPPQSSSDFAADEKEGSFIRLIVGKSKENHHQNLPQFHSGSSQVLPLCSSPSTFIPPH